jgi:hypothetical protein
VFREVKHLKPSGKSTRKVPAVKLIKVCIAATWRISIRSALKGWGEALLGCSPPTPQSPQNRNLENTDFVDIIEMKSFTGFVLEPKSATEIS